MSRFIPVHSRFPYSLPPDLAGRFLVTDDSTAAVLLTTRRIREGKRFGALEIRARNFGAQLRRKQHVQMAVHFGPD